MLILQEDHWNHSELSLSGKQEQVTLLWKSNNAELSLMSWALKLWPEGVNCHHVVFGAHSAESTKTVFAPWYEQSDPHTWHKMINLKRQYEHLLPCLNVA